jgi:hypothetical protein
MTRYKAWCNMLLMAEKKPGKRYPSRDKVKYVPIPLDMWQALKARGEPDERSVSFMARKAIREFLTRK